MSNSTVPAEPRRGARARKQVDRFAPQNGKTRHDGDDSDLSELTESEDERPQPRKRKANGGTRAPRPPKRPKAPKTVPASDLEPIEGLKNDSSLFNALLQPDVALEPLVDDWVHAYQGATDDAAAEKSAVHELVLFLIRACGLSADVDEDEAVDLDGTGEAIDRIQEESVKNNTATYPLIAKVKQLRAFKPNLSSVVHHLIESLKLSGLIYEDNGSTKHSQAIMPLILAWLGSMSSSPLRSIRHTSTFIGLKVHSALCDAAAQVNKDLSVKQRQKEAEAKKSGQAAKKRAKNAENKVKESHAQKVRLEEHMKEIFDVIFIHRLRDTDPAIRTACVHELGIWVKKYPEKYATNTYLNYFVRGSNDPDGGARLETVKALTGLFSNVSLANNASSFTLRLAPRLIKMASLDVETPVRTNAINAITLIDKTGALQDEMEEDREKVARLIFDKEPRVRKAAAGFVQNLWDERAEHLQAEWKSLRAGKKKRAADVKEDELDERLRWKTLAALLVQTAHGLTDQPDEDSPSQADLTSVPDTDAITRAEAAADGLWPQLSDQQEELADYLLLDHSTHEQDMWLLTEEEEDFMLGMLIACIKKEDEEDDEKTKSLMGILPRLFTKHQSEPSRIGGILSIPEHMNLQLYLDMRKTPAYEALWTDVTNQFLKHTDGNVLQAAIRAINKLVENSTMDSTNTSKLAELEEAVFSSLRDAINGEDVFSMQLDDDAAILVEAILLRVSLLGRSRDITSAMTDEEGGQSSGWAIVSEFAKRGGLGFKQEAKLVASAIKILLIQVGWLIRRFSAEDAEDEDKVATLRERQQEAFEIFEKYGIGGGRATESVRREAFQAFIYLHTLFAPRAAQMGHTAAKACPLEMTSDRQHKLGGAFQAAVERYASDLEEDEDEDDLSFTAAQRDIFFLELVAAFVSALCIGVIDVEQAKEPLTHYGRFGATYDQLVKRLVDVLRDEGIYNGEATTVQHVVSEALQNSFSIFLDSNDDAEPEATMALARLGAQAFIVPGLHFTVVKQIHPDDVYDLHVQNLDWVFKKVTTLNKQLAASKDNKARLIKQRARVLMYLKPLALLLGPVTGRDALRIRDHLEKLVDDCGDSTSVRSTAMYRGYEKRLVTIAGKDTGLKVATKKAASKPSSKSRDVVEDSDEERNEPETANGRHKDSDDAHEQEEPEEAETPEEEADPEELEENEENGEDEREDVDLEADADAGMDVDEDEDMEATPTKASQVEDRTPKRRRDNSSLPDLELDPGVIHADEIDLAFTDLPDERERSRSRSLSVEPTAKRRKTTKRY
ncbi:hypothetical protein CcaverHIS002_0109550 [Cutaneotrichosporon cavernicola]|uniref:SCD domain-containing protein n=1 Tax=Cutaneotrichosporon cavernicola TaxID=279322 RepID=A0AA48I281_9TREE|nr:uncharacterized protein CcaverHIS019_0109470 [Cutaneotrichosporon cavernicola]BEI80426.1 hypothetical protein CcaverHIS002_0109550 [Cutaneotrichosporon cavernicola]BEI88229.1 hypothetical protein CcaverHIS019_0109470 [Cutaneotrichosporon cavernicola]BEI96000.1 hypothetical protein CcaverHIS631_0109490 [Cutaneotrichosporon cavernicola]BEJ03774.1 hypothetical protein CcaverHIS641_0109490 [Cutaneotrichosporon cavernicola]